MVCTARQLGKTAGWRSGCSRTRGQNLGPMTLLSAEQRTPLATSRADKSFAARWRTKLHRKLWSTTCGVSEVSGTGAHALDDRTEISSGERRTKAVFKSFGKWRAACRAPSRCAAFSISETPDPNNCQLRRHMFTLTTTS